MKRIIRRSAVAAALLASMVLLAGCTAYNTKSPESVPDEVAATEPAAEPSQEDPDGVGDTFSGDLKPFEEETEPESSPGEDTSKEKDVDVIFFMGQSNMSGAGGDASAAPSVSEDAGMEFRAVSDPTRLYPITEPFGINENNPSGLHEYPGAKKGSMVSAFVNRYHELTGRKVIAVSISMGATDMNQWKTPGVTEDVTKRFETTMSYLKDNGYKAGHVYVLWLHGESDGIEGTDPGVYKTALDDIMRPLFIGGVNKVFIIVPGRTIDYRDILKGIIDIQKQICAESPYYALATTVLSKVSAEYMKDQYHYNQHILNLVGIKAAESVACYTNTGKELIIYDYRNKEYIVPEDVDPENGQKEEPVELSDVNLNELY